MPVTFVAWRALLCCATLRLCAQAFWLCDQAEGLHFCSWQETRKRKCKLNHSSSLKASSWERSASSPFTFHPIRQITWSTLMMDVEIQSTYKEACQEWKWIILFQGERQKLGRVIQFTLEVLKMRCYIFTGFEFRKGFIVWLSHKTPVLPKCTKERERQKVSEATIGKSDEFKP